MTVSVFDHPFLSGLLGDDEVVRHFAAQADIAAMLSFEAHLARAEAEEGVIEAEAADTIERACANLEPDMAALREGTGRDGVVVAELIRQLRATVGEPHASRVHFGATSQDVIDTSLALRFKLILDVFKERLEQLCDAFDELDRAHGSNPLMGRTRMQAAIEMTVGERLAEWRRPLSRRLDEFDGVRRSALRLQLAGPVGTLDKLGGTGENVRRRLADLLGLEASETWHCERDRLVGVADWLSLVSGSLGKFGQDVALMAQNGIDEIVLSGGGGSSAMAHKHNPVRAEVLVALARFNAVQVSAMHQAMVHEQERSGAAWTLEWMALPPIAAAAGASTRIALDLLRSVQRIGSASR